MKPITPLAAYIKQPLLALPISLLLVACGNGSNVAGSDNSGQNPTPTIAPSQPDPAPTSAPVLSYGRLAVAEADQTNVRLLDLDSGNIAADISLQNPASALYLSPQSGYVVAIQRNQDKVEFIDSGLLGSQPEAPSLHSFSIEQAKPTHFDLSSTAASLFFDGDQGAGINAGFQVLTDSSIKQAKALASHDFTQAMHGTAQLRGEFALTTFRSDVATTSLPDQVVVMHQHNDHYHEEKNITESCPGLHGSMQGIHWTVFGCEDGVLAIKQVGEEFSAIKIPNIATMVDTRIGTLKGSHKHDKFLGLTRTQQAFLVDPENNLMTEILWRDQPETTILAYGVDHHQAHFLMFDSKGYLGVYEIEEDFKRVAYIKVLDSVPNLNSGQKFNITSSGSQAHVYISDPVNNNLLTVDLTSEAVIKQLALAFSPAHIAWVGIEKEPAAHQH
ncbi:hypothetical protein K6Y31_11505 [Motilimonas cestriensis]|uniref:Uncharacterized protein n=1 Tax=Motilimonas cestriensis TaxID=2742685 RepID=A0ABS8WCK3_9GAMM|nr:hypothetical protein [Motilimonas cestriensis]MCE2595443.1 hypothetical protein [Motilimonas cestriensis]